MSPSHPTGAPTHPASLPSQKPSSQAPLPDMPGLAPFNPPPELPSLYGHPSQNIGQYHAASVGMNIPRFYYHTPPYLPLNPSGNAVAWGYGPPRAFPDAPPHAGNLQPTTNAPSSAPVQMSEGQVCVEGAGQLATSATTLTESRPGRIYPNRQVSEGGMSHSVD